MRIVILSQIDYASSGFKLYNALKRHTAHEVYLFSGAANNKLQHPTNNIVTNGNRSKVQRIVDSADILHFKGDWPPNTGYLGLRIPEKPIVLTTSGSFFRKKEHGGIGKFCTTDYGRAKLKTSFETDLLYPEYSNIWTPHPIDSDNEPNIWTRSNFPVFMHIPSNAIRKGTAFVEKVFAILRTRIKCETHVISGITFKESVKAKRRATIYFDQFVVGFYGNAAIEAMQWGIPVVCWLSPLAIAQAKGQLNNCPIINEDQSDPEHTAERVIVALKDMSLSAETKYWCDSHHGYAAVAGQWNHLYNCL